jgi:hypothetical protein
VALVPSPSQEQLAVAQARQQQSLERAAGRLQQLVRLRNRLP